MSIKVPKWGNRQNKFYRVWLASNLTLKWFGLRKMPRRNSEKGTTIIFLAGALPFLGEVGAKPGIRQVIHCLSL